MKKLLLAGFAVSALVAPAMAADMPVPAAPIVTWTGYYVGANAGYALSMNSSMNSVGIPGACTDFNVPGCVGIPPNPGNPVPGNQGNVASSTAATFATPSGRNGGFIGGGQFGYNYQFGSSTVIGLEADLQAMTGSNHSFTFASVTPTPFFPLTPVTQTATVASKLDYLGTIRARAGYLWTPNLLLYITGGLAYGEATISSNITQNVASPVPVPGFGPYSAAGTESNVRFGGVVGTGLEWMVAQHWSVRGEYLYTDLGGKGTLNTTLINVDHNPGGGNFSNVAVITTARFKENIARAAVNYHF